MRILLLMLPLVVLSACAGRPDDTMSDIALANATGSICDANPAAVTARGTVGYSWDCGSKSLVAMSSLAYTPYFNY
jgi:hypothetical protein